MIELGMPIDAVISADTGMEFPEMYDHLAKLDDHLYRERGIHITTLRHPKGFEYLMFDEPKQKPSALERRARLGVPPYGNGWPGIRVRWCTGQLKTHLISKEVNRLKSEKNALHYVGIAADEAWRCKNERYPLVEWGVTEAEALQGCYDRGFDFGGLYEIYHRCSCWCCPFQRIDELRKLRVNHPELWARLRRLDNRARAQFGAGPLGLVGANCARSVSALRRKLRKYDGSFYPPGMEAVPKPYAIVRSNQYMLRHSEYLICYCRDYPGNTRALIETALRLEREGRIRVTNIEKNNTCI